MRRARAHLLLLTAVTTGALVAGPFALPGQAADPTVITDVATPAPGRLTATVTTPAAYVLARVGDDTAGYVADQIRAVDPDTHTVTVEVATWGVASTSTLEIVTCTGPQVQECSLPPAASTPVSPLDVVPDVLWPEATHIGADSDPYVVTVSDPDGGGRLIASWTGATWAAQDSGAELDRSGAKTLALPDGFLTLRLLRCASQREICRSVDLPARQVVVQRDTSGTVRVDPALIGASAPTTGLDLQVPANRSIDLDLQVVDRSTGAALEPAHPLSYTGVASDSSGAAHVIADLSGLPTGQYAITGTLSYDEPVLGRQTGTVTSPEGFEVDADGPRVITHRLNSTALYPAPDRYRDSVTLTTTVREAQRFRARYEVRDASGRVVRTTTTPLLPDRATFTWTGRVGRGFVRAGRYTIRTTLTDALGNVTVAPSVSVSVSAKRLKARTFVRTVTPKASMYDAYVARCSSLRSPASRGWAGSQELATATKCNTSVEKTLISTAYSLRVPRAYRYGTLSVSVYGGASKGFSGSRAYIAYDHRDDDWTDDKLLASAIGTHRGAIVKGPRYVYPDSSIAWSLYTAAGAHYDVKSFTVRLGYVVLE